MSECIPIGWVFCQSDDGGVFVVAVCVVAVDLLPVCCAIPERVPVLPSL